MAKNDLTAQALRDVLHYDKETGLFTRLRPCGYRGCHKAGPVRARAGANGYCRIGVLGFVYFAHQLAWLYEYDAFPANGLEIDHVNGIKSDNRISNLRLLTHAENLQNLRYARSHNTNGFLGVTKHNPSGRWNARCRLNGITHSLGMFSTPEEAHAAYIEAKRRLHVGCTL